MVSNNFSVFLSNLSKDPLFVLNSAISHARYRYLDLSKNNSELTKIDVSSSKFLNQFIEEYKTIYNAYVVWGGYKEVRNIYKRSLHFNANDPTNERNIHLGLDLWCEAGQPIFTPLDGIIHSFGNNNKLGDYGPTIIIQHCVKGITFYTLFGHLSLESLNNIEEGRVVFEGEKIAELGDFEINGDYPPHLHFQIIKDLQNFKGDYPGVCSSKDLSFYSENCPDPNLLLKIPH